MTWLGSAVVCAGFILPLLSLLAMAFQLHESPVTSVAGGGHGDHMDPTRVLRLFRSLDFITVWPTVESGPGTLMDQ